MLLKFKDRTWILLGKIIEKGHKEGSIRHIVIPLNEWNMLREEWNDLSPSEQQRYIKNFRVVSKQIPMLRTDMVMESTFVDLWCKGEYDIYYQEVLLVPENRQST